jgi:hypothetical protein
MNIPAKIYESLTAPERMRAAVSAQARNDDAELLKLKETCPKNSYLMTDSGYYDGMVNLMATALVVEYDLMAAAMDFHTAVEEEVPEIVARAMHTAASVETAWRELLAEMGIPWLEMSQAGPPRHHAVKTLLQISAAAETADGVQIFLEQLRECLAT